MTPRIVLVATVHGRNGGKQHRETIPGIPACGAPLRLPHRAISLDDDRLCGWCWGGESGVAQTFEMGAENARIAGITTDKKRPDRERANVSTGPNHNDLREPGAS